MRYSTLVIGIVLLAGCASNPPPPPPPGPAATPVACNTDPAATSVLINVDPTAPAGSQIAPKTCNVKKGTLMTWREQGTTPFKLVFDKSPGPGWTKTYNSTQVGSYQEVTITARNVSTQRTCNYDAYVGTTKLDPTVIIDP